MLPPECLVIFHPVAVCAEHLLEQVAAATVSSAEAGHVESRLSHLVSGIGRNAWKSYRPHAAKVRNVVSHIGGLFGSEVILVHPFPQLFGLVRRSEIYVGDAKGVEPVSDRF